MRPFKIVVSRYNEDLSWMKEAPFNQFRYIVYNKGINNHFEKCNVDEIVNLPNVGKCDHTYLYHIVKNYNNLNDINVFFPGCLNIEYKKAEAKQILYGIVKYRTAIFYGNTATNIKKHFGNFTLDNWSSIDPANKALNPISNTYPAKIRPYGNWFHYMFGNIKVDLYCLHGILSIHRKDIVKHKIERYLALLNAVSVHANPEVGHYIERSWAAVFYPLMYTKIIRL